MTREPPNSDMNDYRDISLEISMETQIEWINPCPAKEEAKKFKEIHSDGFLMRQTSSKRSRAWNVEYESTDVKLTGCGSVAIAVCGSVLVVAGGNYFGANVQLNGVDLLCSVG